MAPTLTQVLRYCLILARPNFELNPKAHTPKQATRERQEI